MRLYDKTQLLKGIYEGCILKIISVSDAYGYKIVTTLQEKGFTEIKEGTIYPLLLRLEKNGYITSEFRVSEIGPSRKYYRITEAGETRISEFEEAWKDIIRMVDFVFTDNQEG